MRSSGAVDEYRYPPKGPLVFRIREQLVRFSQGVMSLRSLLFILFLLFFLLQRDTYLYSRYTRSTPYRRCEVLKLERKRQEAMRLLAPYE